MFQIIDGFLQLVRIPLSFFPDSVQFFINFVATFFGLYLIGKLLRWLWDILPVA